MATLNKNLRTAAGEILAMAIVDLFPRTQIIRTLLTKQGFGAEFAAQTPFDATALTLLEERMQFLIKKDLAIEPIEMMRENAASLLAHHSQNKLAERVLQLKETIVSLVRIGEFFGVSAVGEEIASKSLGLAKLLAFTKAGNVIKVEGILAPDRKYLKNFLKSLEAYSRIDHRKLGEELSLWEEAGEGNWIWLPKGEMLRNTLTCIWREALSEDGFRFIFSRLSDPYLAAARVLPENSRIATLLDTISQEKVPQDEGLLQPQAWTQDLAWSLCGEDHAEDELISSLHFLEKWIKIFAIDYRWVLANRKPDTAGNQRFWDRGYPLCLRSLDRGGWDYKEDDELHCPRGPRIEARLIDSLGREWEGPSIELSPFQEKGGRGDSMMIVRSLFGSLERFAALLVERFEGRLPLWLSPEQVRVLSVKEGQRKYAREVYEKLLMRGIRVGIDDSGSPLAAKVFAVKTAKVPYAIVVGEEEQSSGAIAVRSWEEDGKGIQTKPDSFVEELRQEIDAKTLPRLFRGSNVETHTD